MTQYKQEVERMKLLYKAEQWATGVKALHLHSLSSMWYDNRPEDTANGRSVTDVMFNNGLIERTLDNGDKVYFGEKLTGDELIQSYTQATA